jgi:hypothetical protein
MVEADGRVVVPSAPGSGAKYWALSGITFRAAGTGAG